MPEPSGRTTQVQNFLDQLYRGDASARKKLHDYTCGRFRRTTRKILRDDYGIHDRETVDEVWDTAWLKVDAALTKEFMSARHFLRYVAVIIRHSIVDLKRRCKAKRELTGVHPDAQCDPADPFAKEEVEKAVASLPDPEQEVIDLHIYAGLTLPQTADVLETSVTTVKGRWERACKKLRRALKDRDPGL